LLVRNHFLSLDPYMRGRMEESKSYAAPQPLDQTMIGGTAGIVEASNHPGFAVGDAVVGYLGWQEYGVSDGTALNKVDTRHVPLSAFLGPVGMPGVTAWYGLNQICKPKAGETVLVSAASGAVGSVVGQLAKMAGCRAVGIAGGPEKCAYVRNELGFDACIDHRQHQDVRSMSAALKEAAPDGIDGLFENVGGVGLDAALARMNAFGRIAICGLIAGYEGGEIAIHNTRALLVNRLSLRGFIVSEHLEYWPQALAELGKGVATGQIKYRESVADGLAAAPEAFIGMLRGKNFGKQLVRLA
jgi:NADPH-dependent curcumin reductase CurA